MNGSTFQFGFDSSQRKNISYSAKIILKDNFCIEKIISHIFQEILENFEIKRDELIEMGILEDQYSVDLDHK